MQEHQTEIEISRIEREQKFHDQRFADDSQRTKKEEVDKSIRS